MGLLVGALLHATSPLARPEARNRICFTRGSGGSRRQYEATNSALVRRYKTFVDTGLSSKTAALASRRVATTTLRPWVCSKSSTPRSPRHVPRPSGDPGPEELAQFIDEQSAFLVQKGIYEYSRARAGHYAKVLFKEAQFHEAIERSRWSAYPLGLAMVGELVEGVLRGHWRPRPIAAGSSRRSGAGALGVRPLPDPGRARRGELEPIARRELARRLQLIGLHPPKRAFTIAEPFAQAYFDLMPIHRQLRASEFPTLHGYLRATLCNIHEELTKRADVPAPRRDAVVGRRS